MKVNNIFQKLSLSSLAVILGHNLLCDAAPVPGNQAFTSVRLDTFRRAVDPNVPVYAGPKDDDNVATLNGLREYAAAAWPDQSGPKDSVFFTGFKEGVDRPLADSFVASLGTDKAFWFEDAFPQRQPKAQTAAIISDQTGVADADAWKRIARPSQVFAEKATGTAWVLIPKNVAIDDPYPGPVSDGGRMANWVFFEFNTLTRTGNIDQVVRVNPDDFTDTETVWTKGDSPFGDASDGASGEQPIWKTKPVIELETPTPDVHA